MFQATFFSAMLCLDIRRTKSNETGRDACCPCITLPQDYEPVIEQNQSGISAENLCLSTHTRTHQHTHQLTQTHSHTHTHTDTQTHTHTHTFTPTHT